MIRKVDERLQLCGARRHGPLSEADDGKGTNAEDFIDWKDKMWPRVIEAFGLVEHETEEREPAFEVIETPNHHGPIFQADYTDRNLAQQAQAVKTTALHLSRTQGCSQMLVAGSTYMSSWT